MLDRRNPVDQEISGQGYDVGDAGRTQDRRAMERIRKRVDDTVKDKRKADILKPWYRFLCKRPCFNDDYLDTFNRENVELVTNGIASIDATGITDATGKHRDYDLIVTATGFVASQLRQKIYLAAGFVAGAFSLVVGLLFLFELEGSLPDLDAILRSMGLGGQP